MHTPKNPFLVALATAVCVLAGGGTSAHALCADFNDDGAVSASDALGILKVSIGASQCDVYRCDVDGNGAVTSTDALRVLRYSVGENLVFTCPDDSSVCLNDLEFFFQKIWTPILTDCIACHNPAGIASNTDHVLLPETQNGYLEYNFGVLKNLFDLGKGDLLLTKPQGIDHAGGQRLGITPTSIHYAHLAELLERFVTPVSDCGIDGDFWEGVSFLSNAEILTRAAMIFAGRRPTASEMSAVMTGDESKLRKTIRGLMTGDSFDDFLRESANDHFLTDKYLNYSSSAFAALKGDYQYPKLYDRINLVQAVQGEEAGHEAWEKTNRALAREPLELIVHIVRREHPYTEVVTADYLMVNPWSASVYDTNGSLSSDYDENTWQEGHNKGYRLPNYPHAGVLTSPMFLNRFQSTATNRNRARARWTYRFFLGVDIESLAPRTIDPAELDPADNPTMNNPNCAVCHSVMDPVAGTFQNFGDDGLYLEFDTDSLPRSYKETELYHSGDRWYRDMRAPGLADEIMPSLFKDRSLEWLGQQLAIDPRFARGTVEFWYEGIFGHDPVARPTDPSMPDYSAQLAAYVAQDEIFTDIAEKFRRGTAGTGANGRYNLKDLFVELAMSPLFTASGASDATGRRAIELGAIGGVRLLTPEQLQRKFVSTTGVSWARPWAPDEPDLLTRYRLFYGGIDSVGITRRAEELNALMSPVPQRMAYEMACPLAVREFSTRARDRRLFPFVEPDDLPDDGVGEANIRHNIAWLHQWLLGEFVTDDDPAVDRTFALFNEIRDLRISKNESTSLRSSDSHCELDFESGNYVEQDPDQTIRAWIAVLVYLLDDARFIYE